MRNDRALETYDVSIADMMHVRTMVEPDEPMETEERGAVSSDYLKKLGRQTIYLGVIEYRILTFLAAKPYRAFTRQQIAAAVHSDRYPVDQESLDSHIASLRGQLGFFRDYVKSVPHVGYCFKA